MVALSPLRRLRRQQPEKHIPDHQRLVLTRTSCLYDLDSGLGEPILESILAGGEHALSAKEGQHLVPIMHAVHRVWHLAIVR